MVDRGSKLRRTAAAGLLMLGARGLHPECAARAVLPRKLAQFLLLISLSAISATPVFAADGWVEVGLLNDSNASFGDEDAVRSAVGTTAHAELSGSWETASNWVPTWHIDLDGDAYTRYGKLDSVALLAGLNWSHRLGLGPSWPIASLDLSGGRHQYADSQRSGDAATLDAGISERVSAPLKVSLNFTSAYTTQDHPVAIDRDLTGDAYAGTQRTVTLAADWDLPWGVHWRPWLARTRGPVTVAYEGESDNYAEAARAVASQPAFGPSQFVEQLDGTVRSFGMEGSWEAWHGAVIRLSVRRDRATTVNGESYVRTLSALEIGHAF